MKIELNLDFTQLIGIIEQLPNYQKEKLINLLTQNKQVQKDMPTNSSKKRKLGGYKISISNDFNEPLSEFDEYSK